MLACRHAHSVSYLHVSPSLNRVPPADPNYSETSSGGAELALAITPSDGRITLATMESRLPLDALEVRARN